MSNVLSKAMLALNTPDNYLKIMRASEMSPLEWYRASKMEIKATQYGQRVVLLLEVPIDETDEDFNGEELESRFLYLSPSYMQEKKRAILQKIFAEKNKSVFVQCAEIRVRLVKVEQW